METKRGLNFGGRLSLEGLWKESDGEVNSGTFRELVRLDGKIEKDEKKNRTGKAVLGSLAVTASLAAVAMATFLLARDRFTIPPLESTCNLVADYGQTSSITLEDGTVVHLNAGSTLLYPKEFNKGSRIVFLTGEGNFAVAKDPSRAFIVKTAHMDVQALGTTFCVQSYPGERTVRTTLKEGKVQVSIPSAGGKSYILEPGMQLIYSPSGKSVSFDRVDAGKVMGWEDGYLSFVNASFPEIASVLERRFNVSINYSSEKMKRNEINVRFMPGESLDDMLDVLILLIPGSGYRKENDRIYWHF